MELELVRGQYVPGKYQDFTCVDGIRELEQRIRMRLTARRGEFLPLPEYGSRLHTLGRVKPSQRELAARNFIAEALREEPVALESLSITEESGGQWLLSLRFSLTSGVSLNMDTTV